MRDMHKYLIVWDQVVYDITMAMESQNYYMLEDGTAIPKSESKSIIKELFECYDKIDKYESLEGNG